MVRKILTGCARARPARHPPPLRRGHRRGGRVRARRARAHPPRMAHRRGDGARVAPHRRRHRRLPERDVRERARAHHRAHRRRRGPDRGRSRIADRKRGRQPPARARVLARAGRDRRRSTASRRFTSLALVALAVVVVPHPVDPRLGGRPRPPLARGRLAGRVDRAARRLRRGDVAARCDATTSCTCPTRQRRWRRWSFRFSLLVLGAATLVTAFVAEILVGSLEVFAERSG